MSPPATSPIAVLIPGGFPADRDQYAAEHGSERSVPLALRKLAGWGGRRLPSVRLRRACLRAMGIALPPSGADERPAWIGHDVYVDEVFPELVTIEPGAVVGLRALLLCHDDANRRVAPIRIGRGAYIGAGAIILPGVTIGAGAKVGAGAVVTHDIPPGEVWVGVPARPVETAGADPIPERTVNRERLCREREGAGSQPPRLREAGPRVESIPSAACPPQSPSVPSDPPPAGKRTDGPPLAAQDRSPHAHPPRDVA